MKLLLTRRKAGIFPQCETPPNAGGAPRFFHNGSCPHGDGVRRILRCCRVADGDLVKPTSYVSQLRGVQQWRFVEEDIDLALCAGCLICVPRRAGVMECRRQEVGKQVKLSRFIFSISMISLIF